MQAEKSSDDSNPDDAVYIRTGDTIGLATSMHAASGKFYLTTSFGSQYCNLKEEPTEDQEPSIIWHHSFIIEDAISVHAVNGWNEKEKLGGNRILLYGQAILLRVFTTTKQYLRCLPYRAFKVGKNNIVDNHSHYLVGILPNEQNVINGNCWFTIHPATKLRSEGQKVQAGDEIYFANVGTKRYLSLSQIPSNSVSFDNTFRNSFSIDFDEDTWNNLPVATFTPWVWSMEMILPCSNKAEGYLNGGDPLQLKLINHKEEHLSATLPYSAAPLEFSSNTNRHIYFEDKSVSLELRSLWTLMLSNIKYGKGFVNWGQHFRLLNTSLNMYLGISDNNQLVLVDGKEATARRTKFCFIKKNASNDITSYFTTKQTGINKPSIKYGESNVYLCHVFTRKIVGIDMKVSKFGKGRFGMSDHPRAKLLDNVTSDCELTLNKGFHIALSGFVCNYLEGAIKIWAEVMGTEDDLKCIKDAVAEKMLTRLKELLYFLKPPNKETMDLHSYEDGLMKLRNRQLRLLNHGTVRKVFALLLRSEAHYEKFPTPHCLEIQKMLCKIFGAMVKGNRQTCQRFANEQFLNDLLQLVNTDHLTHSILEIIDNLIQVSPEVLITLTERHITGLFSLLYKNGRNHEVMRLLGRLCVCKGTAMRDKQHQIWAQLKRSPNLLLHTSHQSKLYSLFVNIFLSSSFDHQLDQKWYFELSVAPYKENSLIRIGCAIYSLFQTYPKSKNLKPTNGAIGDDLLSVGFDGKFIWLNGKSHLSPSMKTLTDPFNQNPSDPPSSPHHTIYGCCLDLKDYSISFTLNGQKIPLIVKFERKDNVILVPAISVPGGTKNVQLCLGGPHGSLSYEPPPGYAPLCYFKPDDEVFLRPFLDIGDHNDRIFNGPKLLTDRITFDPVVYDLTHVTIPDLLNDLTDKLAITFHNQWVVDMIDSGYIYGPDKDDITKTDPELCSFIQLPQLKQDDGRWSASEIIRTLISLGCRITHGGDDINYVVDNELPDVPYRQSNGFKPHILQVPTSLPRILEHLVAYLAENAHNKWVKEQLKQGWVYGISSRDDIKHEKLLVPYLCLSEKNKKIYIDQQRRIMLVLVALGYKIYPPPMEHLKDEYTLAQIPFRSFRGQHASYCSGHGKWYFNVKLMKGKMARVGWAIPGFSSSLLLGGDKNSYAIDGYHACKWHDNTSERFGQVWEEGDVITCLLDLDNGNMTFACNGKLIQSPSGNYFAFTGLPKKAAYVPAVSVFINEQVQILLSTDKNSTVNDVIVGYEAIEDQIKVPIPFWYSDKSTNFQVITDSHPYFEVSSPAKDTFAIRCKEVTKRACLRLNMGVVIEDLVEFSDDDITLKSSEWEDNGKVSFSVLVPIGQDPSCFYVGWARPEFIYDSNQYTSKLSSTIYGQRVEITDESGDVASTDYCSGYLIKMSNLIDVDLESLSSEARINCVIDRDTGHMLFTCPTLGEHSRSITLKLTQPGKLFPVIISKPSQFDICQILFTPLPGCKSIASAYIGDQSEESFYEPKVDENIPNLLSSMKMMTVSETRWYQADDSSSLFDDSHDSLDVPDLPCKDQLLITLPQEDLTIGFTELVEFPELYNYHVETLKALRACCSHDNTEIATEISEFVHWNELINSVTVCHWDFELRAEYFNLLNTLYLEHEVYTRLLTQQDTIYAVQSDLRCGNSSSETGRRGSLSHNLFSHDISSCYGNYSQSRPLYYQQLLDLKKVVFQAFDRRQKINAFACRMLSKEFTNFILLPLLTALDGLLVLGFLCEEADREYLLALLHPTLAPPNHKASFYLLALPVDGSIRSQYCRILEHLCDGQLQKRVKGVIEFSKSFVLALQKDQMDRTDLPKDQLQPKVIQEINTPIENQVTYLMSFNGLSADECSTSKALQEELKIFHAKLTGHCGSSLAHGLSEYNWDKMDFLEKMEKLAKLIYKCQGKNNETEGNVHKLRNVIIFNMLKWSREGIEDIEFAEQVFGLLYRQFNETDMLIKALRRTYIIEDSTEFCTSGIFEFCNALAQVRKMLKIGFSNKEERILEKMLRTLRSSELFKRHPDLLRMTGVHNTVIDVMKSYYNSTDKIMHKITTKQGFIALIEECCLFLCAFAQTSDQNQSALFDHILYFLNHCLKYPEQLNVDACSPMDVAIATINNSHTLVLEISEDHLDIVFDLLDKMTQYVKDDEVDPTMRCSSKEYYFADWSPTGAEKCLRFLQSAVWVNGETISQNACTIIRLMIQHPECLGPGYNNQTLTLVDVFNSSFSHMSRGRTSSMATKRKTASIHRQNNTFVRMETDMKICVSRTLRHHSSTLTLNSVTAELIIAFYNTLVRLLSYCITETQDVNYSSDHILPFMQSLLSKDTLKRLLSFPLSFRASDGMSPTHKEAFLMFLNRAYSIEDHLDLLDLINTVFMPDIEATLYTVKIYRNKYEIVDHFHYICQYVMPFLEFHSKLFPSFGPDLPVVMTMMSQCYSLSKASINCNLSSSKINSFLITLTKILPPQAILKLLPTFLTDISTQSSSLPTVIKVITAHYQHYSSYYSSGILTSAYKLAPPGQIEKVYIALLFSWIFEISHDKSNDLKSQMIDCLKALASSLLPETVVPSLQSLMTGVSSFTNPSSINSTAYIHSIELPNEWLHYIEDFANYTHDNWVFEKQVNDWRFARFSDPANKKDNRMRPFAFLKTKERDVLLDAVKQVFRVLKFYGCFFVRSSSLVQVPHKTKSFCLQPNKRKLSPGDPNSWCNFEPSVMDLNVIQTPLYYHNICEAAAIVNVNQFNNSNTPAENKVIKPTKSCSVSAMNMSSSGSEYNPIKFLYGKDNERAIYSFVRDFLRYMKVKGHICMGPFAALPLHLQMTLNKSEYKPFGGQLFQDILSILEATCQCEKPLCNCNKNKRELFPIITSYLINHSSYFNITSRDYDMRPTIASLSEKMQLARMFSQVHHFINDHIDDVFSSSSMAISTSSLLELLYSCREKNIKNLQKLSSFLLGLVKAIDTSEVEVLKEISRYFSLINSTLKKLYDLISKPSQLQPVDYKFIVCCIYSLLPALTGLFNQFKIIGDIFYWDVLNDWPSIFQSLYNIVSSNISLFIKCDAITPIGQCLSILCQVYPQKLLIDGTIFGIDKEHLMSMLLSAATNKLTPDEVTLTAVVIVPILASITNASSINDENDKLAVNKILKLILKLMAEHQSRADVQWMNTLCRSSYMLAEMSSFSLYNTHFLPLLMSLTKRGEKLWQDELLIMSSLNIHEIDLVMKQRTLEKNLKVYANDLSSYLMFLRSFFTHHKHQLMNVHEVSIYKLYQHLSKLLNHWFSSRRFSTNMNNYKCPIEMKSNWNILISCAVFLMQNTSRHYQIVLDRVYHLIEQFSTFNSQIQQAIQEAFNIQAYQTSNPDTFSEEHAAIQAIGSRRTHLFTNHKDTLNSKDTCIIIWNFARVRNITLKMQGPLSQSIRGKWKDLLTRQRRDSMIKCLKAVPFCRLKKHRAMNLFIQEYCNSWLSSCQSTNDERLCEHLLDREDYNQLSSSSSSHLVSYNDPVSLLFSLFKMQASTEQWEAMSESGLYYSYSNAIIESLQSSMDNDQSIEANQNETKAYEHFYNIEAQITIKQEQLIRRGVPSTILAILAASDGHFCPLVHTTLRLGIVQLEGGYYLAQKKLAEEVQGMGDGIWTSISKLISSCSVLDWNNYERSNTSDVDNIAERVFPSSIKVINFFRFLQLLCEGHNETFQNLLREQPQNTKSVNVVIGTVDYLLKLQQSIRDFYWHHSHHDSLELPARESFCVSFRVATQLFRTLTEFIQGPCIGNQDVLAKSRLWDAMSGFLQVFVALQHKLFKHVNHIELLREMLGLQEEMFVLMISLLEGSTTSSSVGQHMLSMFEECYEQVNQLMTFYYIFIKLKDATTSKAFKEYDLNKDGLISYHEFEKAMNAQQHYTKQEIDYLLQLADTNKDGLLDYQEFTERFHQPTHNLGFHICALIQQLSDILPGDKRLEKFHEICSELFRHFESNLGCIELMGRSGRIERVYFHIKSSHAKQWEDQGIKEARQQFLYSLDMKSQMEKLTGFVNFCEETIYQMNYTNEILGVEQEEKEERAEKHRDENFKSPPQKKSIIDSLKTSYTIKKVNDPDNVIFKIENFFKYIWLVIFLLYIIKPAAYRLQKLKDKVRFRWQKEEGSINLPSDGLFTRKMSIFHSVLPYMPRIRYSLKSIRSLFAMNYYKIGQCLSVVTLLINILILLAKKDDVMKSYHDPFYEMFLYLLSRLHLLLSFISIVSFCYLKVPLIIFKKEKEVVRKLENHGDVKKTLPHLKTLDRVVIKSSNFPRKFWDKQIKDRILSRCSPELYPKMAAVLGVETRSKFEPLTRYQELTKLMKSIIDIRYFLWCVAVIFNDMDFLYKLCYCVTGFIGTFYNVFFFSILLLDLMLRSKILMTVLRALLINSKQLMVTLALTAVVIYIYTVIAYNYFRKFYIRELEPGFVRDDCNNMLTCFLFHLDQGVRSGGGIADVILSAFDDQQYSWRLVFDLSFYFFVIVILIALFQGLIIDAFGELRKKDDTILDELKNKCFICGISKTDFDSPHKFDVHTHTHHSMKNYMFFLMHLIGKPETEFTGQESYVWDQYLQERWDFFPAGTCFQMQENERQKKLKTTPKRQRYLRPLSHANTIAKIEY